MVARHDPAWPDKAMFSAILLVLGGFIGGVFELVRPLIEVSQDSLPVLFTDDIPGYTLALSAATVFLGLWSLRKQAAIPAYLGAVTAILSVGLFGLVPFLALVAVGFMVRSHVEGEETHLDDNELPFTMWPDKALAASLFLFVVGGVAATQALLMFTGNFDPLLLPTPTLGGIVGLTVALVCFVASRRVYHLRDPWLGWVAFALGVATMGFYLIGPLLAGAGMVLLALAHREQEFLLYDEAVAPAKLPTGVQRRGRRRKPAATAT